MSIPFTNGKFGGCRLGIDTSCVGCNPPPPPNPIDDFISDCGPLMLAEIVGDDD